MRILFDRLRGMKSIGRRFAQDAPPSPPTRSQLRAIRQAVETYHEALDESQVPSESNTRFDDYFAARLVLIDAIRALRPVEVPAELTGLDPVPWQSVRVDGRRYDLLYDPYLSDWRLVVEFRPVGSIEA